MLKFFPLKVVTRDEKVVFNLSILHIKSAAVCCVGEGVSDVLGASTECWGTAEAQENAADVWPYCSHRAYLTTLYHVLKFWADRKTLSKVMGAEAQIFVKMWRFSQKNT